MVWTRSSQSTRLVSNCAYTILDPYSFYLKTNIKWNFQSILIENEVNITNSTYRRPKGCELYLKGFSKLRVNTNTGNLPGLKISNARWSQLQMVYLLQNLSRHLYRILGNVGQTKFGQLHHQYLALEQHSLFYIALSAYLVCLALAVGLFPDGESGEGG